MFISPWQTVAEEGNNAFTTYDLGMQMICVQPVATRFGKCITWNGASIINVSETSWEKFFYILKRQQIIGIDGVVPNYYNNLQLTEQLYKEAGFSSNGIWGTYLLDLDNDMEKIFANLHRGLRKNIRKMLKRPYELHDISEGENILNDFVKVYNEARQRVGISINSNLKGMLQEIAPSGCRKYFVLYVDGIPAACQGLCYNVDVAIEVILAISNYAEDNKIYAGDLIKWKLIEWCKNHSIKLYDFAGVAPNPKNKKEMGIKRYKEKWGGHYIEYRVWHKSLSYRYDIWKFLSGVKQVVIG